MRTWLLRPPGGFDLDMALAGSDLVHFFLFERLPRAGIEIIIATNSAEAVSWAKASMAIASMLISRGMIFMGRSSSNR